ncbi:hypothetical protein LSUE1_G009476, partial [Lachnellula suecica]
MDKYDLPRKVTAVETTSVAPSSNATNLTSVSEGDSNKKQSLWKWGKETIEEQKAKHLAKQFDGKRGFDGRWFQRPTKHEGEVPFDKASDLESDDKGRYIYRNQLGQTYPKYDDVATYLSPTNFVPKRLVVQGTGYIRETQLGTGDWRRTKIKGSVPAVLKLAEWALAPANRDLKTGRISFLGRINSFVRTLSVGLPLQIMLSLPTTSSWDDGTVEDSYTDWPGYHWKWPKYAINPLDMRPVPGSQVAQKALPSSRKRLLRPRQLIVLKDNKWVLDSNPDKTLSYLFISYANMHFHTDDDEEGRRMISDMAEYATLNAGKIAYWLDYRCRAPTAGPELDADVYRMCDVIRGSHRVVIMLKGDEPTLKQEWGSRMWTLPEALLAPGDNVYFCTPSQLGSQETFKLLTMHKVELSGSVWQDTPSEEEDPPTRLLAEHFTGLLTLSRLEILSNAIAALGDRAYLNYKSHTKADLAYALMGLLHYRIDKSPTDTAFQAMARLSLANDSDRLIERMTCLFPDPHIPGPFFLKLARPDLYLTHLWDIEPLCQVVGVADEDNTVLLDNCRAMHIRWKNFPRMNVVRHYGMKKLLAELFVRSGAWWFLFGINLTITYAPFFTFSDGLKSAKLILALELLVGSFFAVGLLLSFIGPYSVRRLYGGQVLQSTPNLIGFEGVMPVASLEKLVFGNNNGRLSYSPSATPFSTNYRDPALRIGLEPDWISSGSMEDIAAIEKQLPANHHLFTLVDTGSLT